MNYSTFLFLKNVEDLAHGLETIYTVDSDTVDEIVQTYVRTMYEYGVVDFRFEHTSNPQYFEDRAVILDPEYNSNWRDWNVETFQFTTGLLEDIFTVLLYRPDESIVTPVKSMEKYLTDG